MIKVIKMVRVIKVIKVIKVIRVMKGQKDSEWCYKCHTSSFFCFSFLLAVIFQVFGLYNVMTPLLSSSTM